MNRLELFQAALDATGKLGERYPGDLAVVSIIKQLTFLIELEEGRRSDRERLKDITIGVLTVREIEPLDKTVADLLYEVVEHALELQS